MSEEKYVKEIKDTSSMNEENVEITNGDLVKIELYDDNDINKNIYSEILDDIIACKKDSNQCDIFLLKSAIIYKNKLLNNSNDYVLNTNNAKKIWNNIQEDLNNLK